MRISQKCLIALLLVSFIGNLQGKTNSLEEEEDEESDEFNERNRRHTYFNRRPSQRSYNVLPPLSPSAPMTGYSSRSRSIPYSVIPAQLTFQKTIHETVGPSGGYTKARPGLSHRPAILTSQTYLHPGVSQPTTTSRCSWWSTCLPLVYCAPFFEEVRANNLGCQFYESSMGACCRSPKDIRGLSAAQGFSSANTREFLRSNRITLAEFSPRVEERVFSSNQFSLAISQGFNDLKSRDRTRIKLLERGVAVTDPQRPEYGHLQFFRTSPRAMEMSRLALVHITTGIVLQRTEENSDEHDDYGGVGAGHGGNNFLNRGSLRRGIRLFSASNTKLGSSCPATPGCGKKENYYRTIDGSCNNLGNPKWGQAMTSFERIIPPRYADGMNAPRRSVTGGELPSARLVSTSSVPDVNNPSREFTLSVMQWGQFIDHDLTHAPIFRFDSESGIECCDVRGQLISKDLMERACFPIAIPWNDRFFSSLGRRCMNFIRSMPAPLNNCSIGYREQMNQVTHFLDGSAVYGSSAEEENELRERFGGLLKTQGRGLLPPDTSIREEDCFLAGTGLNCFRAGDNRVNEQPQLSVIHTIWVRQHNRIAKTLAKLNPHWSDETIYQETRKVVVAQIQHIVYNEWLPLILGTRITEESGLLPRREGFISSYDPSLNPTIRNEFATVAFRFGHTLVEGMLRLFDDHHKNTENHELFEHFNRPHLVYQPGKVDQLLRGLAKQPMQSFDNFVVDDLTNKLFQTETMPFGMDLIALNIQRARDHGIPSYNELRQIAGLPRANTFNAFRDVVRPESVAMFRQLYSSVDDIDPFVAGISEVPVNDGILGPTFSAIIRDQFTRLKFGDRFFYENGGMSSSFTEAQLHEIRKTSWAEIICGNSENIKKVQPLAFRLPGPGNQKESCSSPAIPKLDFRPWISKPKGYNR